MVAVQESDLVFQREFFLHCMPEFPPLFIAEWNEALGDNPTQQELDVSWDDFIKAEMAGMLLVFTARVDKKLVGYIITILRPHLHFKQTIYAFVDAFFLLPEYRRDELDEEFIIRNEILLIEQGAKCVQFAIPASSWQYRLMKKLQYLRRESIFAKWL